jgi:hypothetical protein
MKPDAPPANASSQDLSPEAAFWKARYEEERLRLAKLLVAYKDLEAELRRAGKPDAPVPVEAKPAPVVASPEPVKSMTPA